MPSYLAPSRTAAIRQARAWLAHDPLFLDTETTGFDNAAQVVEIALLDQAGTLLFETLVQPTVPIHPGAQDVHGLTPDDLVGAPRYSDVQPRLAELLHERHVVIYNAAYDLRLLHQSALSTGQPAQALRASACCAMELYALFYGERNPRRPGYKWHKLEAAISQCGLARPDDPPTHRARHDAELARRLVIHLAAQPLPGDEPPDPAAPRPGLAVIETQSPHAGDYFAIFKRLDQIPILDVQPQPYQVQHPPRVVMTYALDWRALSSAEVDRLLEHMQVQYHDEAVECYARLTREGYRLLAEDVRTVTVRPAEKAGEV